MSRAVVVLLVVLAAVLVSGCGQKRDLVLPDAPPAIDPTGVSADDLERPPGSRP